MKVVDADKLIAAVRVIPSSWFGQEKLLDAINMSTSDVVIRKCGRCKGDGVVDDSEGNVSVYTVFGRPKKADCSDCGGTGHQLATKEAKEP